MGRRKRTYTDKFRAGALVLLQGEGYPEQFGALSRVSTHLDVPESTLRGWWNAEYSDDFADLRAQKKREVRDLLDDEIREALQTMTGKRDEATYRDLATTIAIFIDKKQLLAGKPTSRAEVDMDPPELMDMDDDELAGILSAIAEDRQAEDSQRADE